MDSKTGLPRHVIVRRAVAGDVPALTAMIRELNLHQREPHEHSTEAAVHRDLFGPDPALTALLAELDGKPAGYATYHRAYDASYAARGLYMVDLFVAKQARRRGVARALVAAVAAAAKAEGASYLWWAVKAWNQEALEFYRSLGAIEEPIVAQALVFDNFERLEAGSIYKPKG